MRMKNNPQLAHLRKNYTLAGLNEQQAGNNPLILFSLWFEQSLEAQLPEPNAMILATSAKNGKVSARTVLLKELDETGFVFFTNYSSRKGLEMEENHHVALVFLWLELERQIRIEGVCEKILPEASDAYFAQRPRESQLGAWASDQSKEIASKDILNDRFKELEALYHGKSIPRPANWGGYRVVPEMMEFWQGRPGRMHDRIVFHRPNPESLWSIKRLQP